MDRRLLISIFTDKFHWEILTKLLLLISSKFPSNPVVIISLVSDSW